MRVWNKRESGVPAAAVYVGRPSPFGNPFSVERYGRAGALQRYSDWLHADEQTALRERVVSELAGRDLVCWCSPLQCHADMLMQLANGGAQ